MANSGSQSIDTEYSKVPEHQRNQRQQRYGIYPI